MVAIAAPDLTTLYALPHGVKTYLACNIPRIVMTCQVNNPAIARGAREIAYDHEVWGPINTGGYYGLTDMEPGMSLYVGSAASYGNLGRVRIKSVVAGLITVAENEDIPWADDIWVSVADVHEPWGIFPRIEANEDGTALNMWEDYDIAYPGHADANPPVAVAGPPIIGFLSGSPPTFTAHLDGSGSYGLDGATISSYSWTVVGGTPEWSGTAETDVVFTAGAKNAVGYYTAKLVVVDSNGRTSVGYRVIIVYTSRDYVDLNSIFPYNDFEVTNLSGNYSDGGWTASFKVRDRYGRLNAHHFRDDAQVILFAEGTASNGDALPVPGNHPDHANLLFVGWVVGETVVVGPDSSYLTFQASGICERMKIIDSFPDTLEVAVAPTNWYQYDESLTVDLAILRHLRWRSNILEIVDFSPTGKTAKKLMRQDFAQGNLYDQCQQLLNAICARMAGDKTSSIYCRVDPQVLPTGERGAIPTQFNLASWLWRDDITFEKRDLNEVSLVDLAGVSYDGSGVDPETDAVPILSLAPGNTPRYEGSMEKVDGMVLESQAQANQLSGDILAWRNNQYPTIPVRMVGAWTCLDVAPPEWIGWTLPAAATLRDFSWTAARFINRSMTMAVNNDGGQVTVDLSLEKEADGPDGVDGNYPPDEPEEPTSPVPVEPPLPPVPVIPPTNLNGTWRQHVLAATNLGPYYTEGFVLSGSDPTGDPTWALHTGGMGADVDCICLAFHQWTPESCNFVLTADNVYRRLGLSGDWTSVLSVAGAAAVCGAAGDGQFYSIQTSPAKPDYIYAVYSNESPKFLWLLRSVDNGTTWTALAAIRSLFYSPANYCSQLQIDGITGNYMYLNIYGGITGSRLYASTDAGATWNNLGNDSIVVYHQAMHNHANPTIVYSTVSIGGGLYAVEISTDSGANFATIANQSWGGPPLTYPNEPGKHVFNSQLSLPGLVRSTDGKYVFKSIDYGVTWTRVATGSPANIGYGIEVVPDAVNKLYLHRWNGASGSTHGILATGDEGATRYGKNGADPQGGGSGSILSTTKIRDLTPIWTLE